VNTVYQIASQVANVVAGKWVKVDQDLRQWALAFGVNY
jgi:hypothetical protein